MRRYCCIIGVWAERQVSGTGVCELSFCIEDLPAHRPVEQKSPVSYVGTIVVRNLTLVSMEKPGNWRPCSLTGLPAR